MPYKVGKATPIDTSGDPEKLKSSMVDLAKYIEKELERVAASQNEIIQTKVNYVAPTRPRQGMVAYADGSHWNPGSGEGLYAYEADNTWHFLGGGVSTIPRGYLGGLVQSTTGTSTSITTAVGVAVDDGNTVWIALLSAMTKTTSAWASGTTNGGKLDAGAVANNTWYDFYLLSGASGVDIGFVTSPNAPTLPAGYNTAKRYIGSWKTNGAAQWLGIVQDGDRYVYVSGGIQELFNLTLSATPTVISLVGVPPKGRIDADMACFLNTTANGCLSYFYSLDSTTQPPLASGGIFVAGYAASTFVVRAVGGQIRHVDNQNGGGVVNIAVNSFTNRRGKDA